MRIITVLLLALISVGFCHEYEIEEPDYELDEECIQRTLASDDDILALKNFQTPHTRNGRCLLACMYKKLSIMTPDGKYSNHHALISVDSAPTPYTNSLENTMRVVHNCAMTVHNIDDDDEGCDIAAALFSCIVDYSRQH